MTAFRVGEFEFFWLRSGRFALDGGAMFGVVPKVLWHRKYPAEEENHIPLAASPILLRTPRALVLIETGLGNKLTDKQKRIYRVREEWSLPADLATLGIKRGDIDFVVLTHYDFDHAGGVIMRNDARRLELTFPRATHVLQRAEWEDVLAPNRRSANTYWPLNNELLRRNGRLELIDGAAEILPGLSVYRTGGHTRGHQIVRIDSQGQTVLHLGDLLPTHAHANPLWLMAYDNFPLDSIAMKESWIGKGVAEGSWFTFYHDAAIAACRFDERGAITEQIPIR